MTPPRFRVDGSWLLLEPGDSFEVEVEYEDVTHLHPDAAPPMLRDTGRRRAILNGQVITVDGGDPDGWRDGNEWLVIDRGEVTP